MISHEYKCIFIHIPRTAGSSIEKWICGKKAKLNIKHLIASQAKKLYKDYWNDYFKFSIVRNPWDRVVSCLKHPNHFKIRLHNKKIDYSNYIKQFTHNDILLEHDYRYSNIKDLISDKHKPNTVYGNILDEKLDYVFKYENLSTEVLKIKKTLNIKQDFNFHKNRLRNRNNYHIYYDSKDEIETLFYNDIIKYGYQY